MNNNYLAIDELFINLFNKFTSIEESWIIDNKFNVTNNEIHIINKIGTMQVLSFGTLAESLKITPGTLTVAINKLVKKEYIDKLKNEKDKRAVFLSLTDKGETIFTEHRSFRHSLIKNTLMKLEKNDSRTILNILRELDEKFTKEENSYKK